MLVDLDPFGGGIELVVGCEDIPGLRWPEVSRTFGRVSATALRRALPSVGELSVLSWSRLHEVEITPSTARNMVTAGQRGSRVVVIDLARHVDEVVATTLTTADVVLLVSTCDVRSTAAAACMSTLLQPLVSDVRLVVRTTSPGELDATSLATALGLPLAGTVATQRGVARAINEGWGPPARGRFAKSCSALVDELGKAVQGRR